MGRVQTIFAELKSEGRKALMPFICGGHPTKGETSLTLTALEQAGASIIEVGIPFSDPIADGSVIAAAMHEALAKGATPNSIFDEVASIRPWLKAGVVAMVSASIVHRCGGPQAFVSNAKNAGFDGLIVPDAPLEESGTIAAACRDLDLAFTLLISPATPPARAEKIVQACTGFVYLLARVGITGEQSEPPDISGRVTRLREMTDLPIAVGFGISTPDHVRSVVRHADAAIVGSALVRRMSDAARAGKSAVSEAEAFTRQLTTGLVGFAGVERQSNPPARGMS